MTLLATTGLIAMHALALCGWGRMFARGLGLAALPLPLSTASGLGVVIGLGGLLSALGWVSPIALWIIVGVGLVGFGLTSRRFEATRVPGSTVLAFALAALVLLWVAASLVPALQFNYHDDYQKYFVHPVRMLQTGRVQGSSLSAIGFETLGGQAFLQTFVLSVGQVDALNAVDLGLALPLCILIAGTGAPGLRAAGLLAALSLLLINPQIVNISSTFTGSALTLTVMLLALHTDDGELPNLRHALFVGCLLAALCALKTSFALLALVLALAYGLAIALRTRSAAPALHWLLACAASGLLWIAPWLLAHAASYFAIAEATPSIPAPSGRAPYRVSLWSTEDTGYGDGFAPYTCAVVLVVAVAAFGCLTAGTSKRRWVSHFGLASAVGLAAAYLILLYIIGPAAHGSGTSLRLFVTMLLGVFPACQLLTCEIARPKWRVAAIVPLVLTALALLPFAGGLPARGAQSLEVGSLLAFEGLPRRRWYIDYNDYVLYGAMRQRVLAAQSHVPAGAPLIAWINTPFWLDFTRNPISDLELAGLQTPWARVPDAAYVIWEHNGAATPQLAGYDEESREPGELQARIAAAGARMALSLIDLVRRSEVLYDDRQIMVLRVADPSALRARYALEPKTKPPSPDTSRLWSP